MCRDLYNNGLTGTLPTELGNMDALQYLCVPLTHRACTRACASSSCELSAAAAWGYRDLNESSLTGTLPTELGTLAALAFLCVKALPPPRLHRRRIVS